MQAILKEAVPNPAVARGAARPTLAQVSHVRPLARDAAVTGAFFILFAVIILQKVAIPLGSGTGGGRLAQLHASVPVFAAVLGWLALQGRVRVDLVQLGMLGLFFAACLPTLLAAEAGFSIPSFLAAMILYGAFAFRITIEPAAYRQILQMFQRFMVLIALLALGGYVFQYLFGMPMNLDTLLPEAFIYREYVYLQPVVWGSSFMKPNGFFMLEASFLSQFLALAIVVELIYFQRMWVLMLFAAAVLATVAGTGLVLLAVTLPFLLVRMKPRLLVPLLVAGSLLAAAAVATGWTDVVYQRLGTFAQPGTSAHSRFVAPFELPVATVQEEGARSVFVGDGPGNVQENHNDQWNVFAKVVIEYGVLPFVIFLVFSIVTALRHRDSTVLAWALLVVFYFLSGAFLQPPIVYLMFVLAMGYCARPKEAPG